MKTELRRDIKTPGAILMGLGSIVGTGIFVSIAIATQVAGSGIIIAIVIAAVLATFNGLSSAQLAAAHPVSGGTYEYGYRFLGSYFGFTAGWMFMVAKSASAATAVLGCIGYLFYAFDVGANTWGIVGAGILIYYAITNLSALFLPEELRLYPRAVPAAGLFGCLFLAFWIDPKIWIFGILLIIVGLLWHTVVLRYRKNNFAEAA